MKLLPNGATAGVRRNRRTGGRVYTLRDYPVAGGYVTANATEDGRVQVFVDRSDGETRHGIMTMDEVDAFINRNTER